MSEFYVGYLPKAPPGVGRFLRRTVLALITLAGLIPLVLLIAQQPFAASRFEYLQYREYEGVIREQPFAALLTRDGAYLLVASGKHGAKVDAFDQQGVRLSGSLIQRGNERMLELLPRSVKTANVAAASEPSTNLGSVTLSGEIVDSKCYLGVMNPGNGKVHRDCAVRCISGGIPPAFVVRDASGVTRTLILTGVSSHEILDYVAEPVKIAGQLSQSGTIFILRADRLGNKPAIERY